MKLIDISTPKYPNTFAKVDDEDYEWLNQWKWRINAGGYAERSVWGIKSSVLMHRLIIKPQPSEHVDHINRDKIDNRRQNLRACTVSQNLRNAFRNKTSSGFKGVSFHKGSKRFIARICVNGSIINLGSFLDAREAAMSYNKAASEIFGEFARLNEF